MQYHFQFGFNVFKLNKHLRNKLKNNYDFIFLYRPRLLYKSTFKDLRKSKVFIYNNDDPFSKMYHFLYWYNFKKLLYVADHIFSYRVKNINDYRLRNFKNTSLSDILDNWETYIKSVLSVSTVPVLQYSVFGDKPKVQHERFLEKSYLEHLADCSNSSFEYKIPMFEFDWLNEQNYKVTKPFAVKYFDENWEKACVERENIRPSKYFQNCGHPNAAGHKIWANFINKQISSFL